MPEMYLVGGAVRDHMLGVKPNDYDFTVVAGSYDEMYDWLVNELDVHIFVEKRGYVTIRGRFPSHHFIGEGVNREVGTPTFAGIDMSGKAVDFVLARRDGAYSDGRHPDEVEVGSLYDDLARRDFTMNAMALTDAGVLIDPFGGKRDLEWGELVAVGKATDRLTEDALRAVRAIRFAVTKNLTIHPELHAALSHAQVLYNLQHKIAEDRIRQELHKALKHDTLLTLKVLERYPLVRAIVLGPNNNIWLKPTTEE